MGYIHTRVTEREGEREINLSLRGLTNPFCGSKVEEEEPRFETLSSSSLRPSTRAGF